MIILLYKYLNTQIIIIIIKHRRNQVDQQLVLISENEIPLYQKQPGSGLWTPVFLQLKQLCKYDDAKIYF